MRPHLYVKRYPANVRYLGEWHPQGGIHVNVGTITLRDGPSNPYYIYQKWICGGYWCASLWDTIPDDGLWWSGRRRTVFSTYVKRSSLDFLGTPLEHRNNSSIAMNRMSSSIAKANLKLAYDEWLLWKGCKSKTFIPFKNPHPQGYRGVWMRLEDVPIKIQWALTARDTFDTFHSLEIENY